MTKRFVPSPNWPTPPPGWRPPPHWRPDPRWGPAPRGWQFWQDERGHRNWLVRHKVATAAVAAPVALIVLGLVVGGAAATSAPATFADSAPAAEVTPTASPTAIPTASASGTPTTSYDAGRAKASASAEAAKKAAKEKAAKEKAAKTAKEKAAKEQAAKEQAAKEQAAKEQAAKEKAAKEQAAKEQAKAKAARKAAEKRKAEKSETTNCTPGYSPCLPPASDYDCAGGSGNGPKYVDGPVKVTGADIYDLDRNGDGVGCES